MLIYVRAHVACTNPCQMIISIFSANIPVVFGVINRILGLNDSQPTFLRFRPSRTIILAQDILVNQVQLENGEQDKMDYRVEEIALEERDITDCQYSNKTPDMDSEDVIVY